MKVVVSTHGEERAGINRKERCLSFVCFYVQFELFFYRMTFVLYSKSFALCTLHLM